MRLINSIFFLLLSVLVQAQVTSSENKIQFGEVYKGEATTKSVTIINQFAYSVNCTISVTNKDFYPDAITFTLQPGKSRQLDVIFDPVHNVGYNAELLINTDSRSGAISVDLIGEGNYRDTYYANTRNLWEEDLKSALKTILAANYVNLGYNGARDQMYGNVDNINGDVTCVYTGRVATFNTRTGANDKSFNCEHTWPQSLFNSNEPEKADIHHLFPTDVNANSKRSNYQFAVVTNPSWSEGGSKYGGSYFEPRDEHKGDAARALFYFCTRYTNYSNFLTGQESTLRSWAASFPPTQAAMDRNQKIFAIQKNRNPYVDHPEFLERITSISTTSKAVANVSYQISSQKVDMGSYPQTKGIVYHLVVLNDGNQAIHFSKLSNTRLEFVVDNDTFTVQPGESKTISIELRGIEKIGNIKDTLLLVQQGVTEPIQIELNGNIEKLSHVELNMNSTRLDVRPDRILVKNSIGYSCAVYRMNGQLCMLNEISSDFTEIQTAQLATGIYFVTLTNSKGEQIVKKFSVHP